MTKKHDNFRVVFTMVVVAALLVSLCGCSFMNRDSTEDDTTSNVLVESNTLADEMFKNFKNCDTIQNLQAVCYRSFNTSTVREYFTNKEDNENELCINILNQLEFKNYDGEKLTYTSVSEDEILSSLAKDTEGFVKDYNNLLGLKMSDNDLTEYIIDYLNHLLKDDNAANLKRKDSTVTLHLDSNSKFDSDAFLTELFDTYLENTLTKIKSTSFSSEQAIDTAINTESGFKVNSSKVFIYPFYQEETVPVTASETQSKKKEKKKGKKKKKSVDAVDATTESVVADTGSEKSLKALLKILVTVNEVYKGEDAYKKICEINQLNSSLTVNYNVNDLYYLRYTIDNLSGTDFTYNNCFYAIDSEKNSYSLKIGECFGITSSSVLPNGSTTVLDVVLIGRKKSMIGWYDEVNKFFYNLEIGDE